MTARDPNPATGHSIAAPRYDGTVWEKLRHSIRTEAFNTGTFNIGMGIAEWRKEGSRSDRLGERAIFSLS